MCSPSHPISVLICDICGRFPLLLEIYSPTDSTDFHRFYVSQYPYSSALSVGTTFAPNIRVHLCYLWEIPSHPDICGRFPLLVEIYSPTDHRFYISYVLSVRDLFIRCICGNLTKSIAIDFSNDTIINVICIEINKDTDMLFGEAKISKQLLMMYWF